MSRDAITVPFPPCSHYSLGQPAHLRAVGEHRERHCGSLRVAETVWPALRFPPVVPLFVTAHFPRGFSRLVGDVTTTCWQNRPDGRDRARLVPKVVAVSGRHKTHALRASSSHDQSRTRIESPILGLAYVFAGGQETPFWRFHMGKHISHFEVQSRQMKILFVRIGAV